MVVVAKGISVAGGNGSFYGTRVRELAKRRRKDSADMARERMAAA
jgi:hypothetical protein